MSIIDPASLDPAYAGEGIFYAERLDEDTVLVVRHVPTYNEYLIEVMEHRYVSEYRGQAVNETFYEVIYSIGGHLGRVRTLPTWYASLGGRSTNTYSAYGLEFMARAMTVASGLLRSLHDGTTHQDWAEAQRKEVTR